MEYDPTLEWNSEERTDLARLRQALERRRSFVRGLYAVAVVAFVALVWAAGSDLLADNIRQVAAADWPVAQGVVTTVGYSVRPPRKKAGDEAAPAPRFQPRVHYTYRVGGKTFTGDRHRFLLTTVDSPEEVRSAVPQYAKGVAVTVYYDPEDTARSLLEPVVDQRIYPKLLLVLGIAIQLWQIRGMIRRHFDEKLQEAILGGPLWVRIQLEKMGVDRGIGRTRISRPAA